MHMACHVNCNILGQVQTFVIVSTKIVVKSHPWILPVSSRKISESIPFPWVLVCDRKVSRSEPDVIPRGESGRRTNIIHLTIIRMLSRSGQSLVDGFLLVLSAGWAGVLCQSVLRPFKHRLNIIPMRITGGKPQDASRSRSKLSAMYKLLNYLHVCSFRELQVTLTDVPCFLKYYVVTTNNHVLDLCCYL